MFPLPQGEGWGEGLGSGPGARGKERNKMTHVRANTLILTLLFSVAIVAQPRIALAEVAGHLARVFGDVRVDEQRANTGDTFESGATISTGSRAFSVLKFADGQVVALRAESVLSVDDYMYAENDLPDSRSHTSLLEGGMRALTGIIGTENPEAVSFNTPVATIGIRGTEMVIGVQSVAANTAAAAGQGVDLSRCFKLVVKVLQDQVDVMYPQNMPSLAGRPAVSRCEDLNEEDLRELIERVRQAPPASLEVVAITEGQSFGLIEGTEAPPSEAPPAEVEAIIQSEDDQLDVDLEAFQDAEDSTTVEIAALEALQEDPTPEALFGEETTADAGEDTGGAGTGGTGGGGGEPDVPLSAGSNPITGQ